MPGDVLRIYSLDTHRAIVVENEIPSTQTGAGSVEGIFGVT